MLRKILALMAASLLLAGPAFALVNINSQGASLVPVSVTTGAAVKIIPANANRINWTLYSEASDLRCTAGTYSQASGTFTAPATAPTSTVGFLLKGNQYINERQLFLNSYTTANETVAEDEAKVEIDCIAVTATTGVDTWEEQVK